eukprot:1155358-Pelagomonas_calceolata.AAC.2
MMLFVMSSRLIGCHPRYPHAVCNSIAMIKPNIAASTNAFLWAHTTVPSYSNVLRLDSLTQLRFATYILHIKAACVGISVAVSKAMYSLGHCPAQSHALTNSCM